MDNDDNNQPGDHIFVPLLIRGTNHLSAEELLSLTPNKCGYCMKFNNSFLAWLFPWIFPQWKSRYFILIGNYLFRFNSVDGDKPKGVPIPVDSLRVQIKNDDNHCIEISTLRKNYILKFESNNEAVDWMNTISRRKAESIKELMGHKEIPNEIKIINEKGFKMFSKRLALDRQDYNTDYENSCEKTY
eukprot:gene5316-7380_t